MEKLMICVGCSPLQSDTRTMNDGTTQVFERYNCQFSDGIDSVLCETSKNTTALIKQNPLEVDHLYSVNIKLRVTDYKDKQGNPAKYFGATLMDYAKIV